MTIRAEQMAVKMMAEIVMRESNVQWVDTVGQFIVFGHFYRMEINGMPPISVMIYGLYSWIFSDLQLNL